MPCIALWYDARVRIEPRDLLWDSGNVAHIAWHGVTPQEVEEVCGGSAMAVPAHRGRLILIGPTDSGRILAVVLEQETRRFFYCVTARPASRRERREYREHLEGRMS
ncbi:MAG: BrnT family toxin [Pyrinomonadaceae bacterium]|nr:BrnT family toxin [Pyrinomonadaceae bacterium]